MAAYVIGGIGFYFLLKSGALDKFGLSGAQLLNQEPVAPLPTGAELTPAQLTFAVHQAGVQNQEVDAGIGLGVQATETIAKDLGVAATSTFAQAIPIVGAAVAAVANILLAQHTARLQGAVQENQLIPQCVQAFDADISGLITAYNQRQFQINPDGTASAAATAVQQMDMSLYNFMKSNAKGPGRAWRDASNPPISSTAVPPCNSSCTAECCIFWNDFNNIMSVMFAFFSTGKITNNILAKQSGKTVTFNIPTVVPPPAKYGTFGRAGYSVVITLP
jgi:hypothetical protein